MILNANRLTKITIGFHATRFAVIQFARTAFLDTEKIVD